MRAIHRRLAFWAFLLAVLISIPALFGWLANVLSLAGMSQQSIPMAPFTAICFFLSGLTAMLLLRKKSNNWLSLSLLSAVFIFCLLVLFDSLTNYPLHIERIFGESPGRFNNFPIGRMSPITSILFLILSGSLILMKIHSKSHKTAILLSLAGCCISFTFVLGYLYGEPLLYGKAIIPPAWNTSFAFFSLFSGTLIGFGTNDFPLNLFSGETMRARLMRNFLPSTLFIVVLAGWSHTILSKIIQNHVIVSAFVTIFSIAVLGIIIIKLAKNIGSNIDNLLEFKAKTQQALLESELHFRTLADSGQALIWTSGIDKKCNYFNKPWLDFTGRTLEQEMGDKWAEGVHPDDLPNCFEIYSNSFDRHESFSMDYRLRHHDGTYHWIQDNGTPRFNIDGEFIGYIGHCLDITERKRTVEALEKSEERYRLISSLTTDYTFSSKILPDGKIELDWVAGAFESISGYTVEEFKKRGGWRATILPEDYHIDDNDIARLKNNQETESQIRTINKDGEIVWVQVFARPIWDEKKNCLTGIYGAVKNITDRKNAEQRQINSETQFRELLENVNLVAIILDSEGQITFCNDFLLNLTGYRREELIGQNWFKMMIPKDNKEVIQIFKDGLKKGEVSPRFENPILTKTGQKLDIAWSNTLQKNSANQWAGIASIGLDVTQQNIDKENVRIFTEELEYRVAQRTAELEEKNADLERMNKLFVGRELRMVELKNSIRELEARLNGEQS